MINLFQLVKDALNLLFVSLLSRSFKYMSFSYKRKYEICKNLRRRMKSTTHFIHVAYGDICFFKISQFGSFTSISNRI